MRIPLLLYGFALWLIGTIALRLAGQHLLRPGSLAMPFILFAASFAVMAWLARRLCRGSGLTPTDWPAGAVSLALPTLVLDPFSSAFFPLVFPNISPDAAGLFGGWMLACCAGALVGGTLREAHASTSLSVPEQGRREGGDRNRTAIRPSTKLRGFGR
jgi:uncharacterized protein DUF5367